MNIKQLSYTLLDHWFIQFTTFYNEQLFKLSDRYFAAMLPEILLNVDSKTDPRMSFILSMSLTTERWIVGTEFLSWDQNWLCVHCVHVTCILKNTRCRIGVSQNLHSKKMRGKAQRKAYKRNIKYKIMVTGDKMSSIK